METVSLVWNVPSGLYSHVFNQYRCRSVVQLSGAHNTCERVSNFLTKMMECTWLMKSLKQSTRGGR